MTTTHPFFDLPSHIQVNVFSFLDSKALFRLVQCSRFYRLLYSDVSKRMFRDKLKINYTITDGDNITTVC